MGTNAMTSAERIEAALAGQPVDRLPFCPFLAYVWESFPAAVREAGQAEFHRRIGADPLWRGAPCPVAAVGPEMEVRTAHEGGRAVTEMRTPAGTLRQAYARSEDGNTAFLVEHPVKTREDFRTLRWIEEHTRFETRPEPVRAHFAGQGGEGLSLGMLIPRSKSAFQMLVEHYVGTEELIYALADFPEEVEALLEIMVANDLEAARLASASGMYRHFITWEDSSTQNYSPALYDRYIAPQISGWCRLLAAAGQDYVQHACGHVRALLPAMKRDGVAAVESLSAAPTGDVSVREARRLLGPECGIVGGIEPTAFLNLPESRLPAYVESILEAGLGGPFVPANSDSCPPGVTEEKFRLAAETVRLFRV